MAFDWKKVPKKRRVFVGSSPLRGAGRVEDTINLLAHAARKLVAHVADLHGLPNELVVDEMGIPLLAEPSMKRGLDRCDGTMGSENLRRRVAFSTSSLTPTRPVDSGSARGHPVIAGSRSMAKPEAVGAIPRPLRPLPGPAHPYTSAVRRLRLKLVPSRSAPFRGLPGSNPSTNRTHQ